MRKTNPVNSQVWQFVAIASLGLNILLAKLIATHPAKPVVVPPQTQAQPEAIQTKLLLKALIPQTATEAALSWARGVTTRNGSLQFALLSPELQTKAKAAYLATQWVTGVSSPWVESYKITRQVQQDEGWEFEIQYQMRDSTGSTGVNTDRLRVNRLQRSTYPEGWYITQLRSFGSKVNLFGWIILD